MSLGIASNENPTPDIDSTRQKYTLRAAALAGVGPDYSYLWEDFVAFVGSSGAPGWTVSPTGTGGTSSLTGVNGGIQRLSTGATAASSAVLSTGGGQISNNGTQKWYVAMRFRAQTAIDAQSIAAMGIWGDGTNNTVTVGVFGSVDTVNFRLQYDGYVGGAIGTTLSTGKAIDTNFHVFEIYCRGDGVIRVVVDGGAELTATLAAPATDHYGLRADARNGTTAANRNLDLDWVLSVTARS